MLLPNHQEWARRLCFVLLALAITPVSLAKNPKEVPTKAGSDPSVSSTRAYSVTNPATAGQSVTLYAQVIGPPGALITPTGSVAFFDGPTSLGSSELDGSFAVLETSFTTSGTHPIVARYSGDTFFLPSASTVLIQSVNMSQPPPAISSCRPTSSLTTLVQESNVTAYVPK